MAKKKIKKGSLEINIQLPEGFTATFSEDDREVIPLIIITPAGPEKPPTKPKPQ